MGRAGEDTIREVWDGARTAALRTALANDDYSLGCQSCGEFARTEARSWSTAAQFDMYAGREVPTHPTRMDFVMSNTCNLQCLMCTGFLSSSIRAQREHLPPLPAAYPDSFFEELRDFLPHLEDGVFLGGEPFLAREPRRVWDLMLEVGATPRISVTTNGTHWNERIEHYLSSFPMHVALSIDGTTAETVESLRVGVDFEQLMANVDHFQRVVGANGGLVSLNYCLMVQNWHEFGDFLAMADDRGLRVDVMTVYGAERFSLFALEPGALRGVVRSLEALDPGMQRRLTLNRPVWDAELARLQRHLDDSGVVGSTAFTAESAKSVVPVEIAAPPKPPSGVQEELERWAGRPAITATVHDELIHTIDLPEWAPASFRELVSRPMSDCTKVVVDHFDASSHELELDRRPWGLWATTVLATSRGSLEVRAAVFGSDVPYRMMLAWPDEPHAG
jgi:hypothetical protein